MFLIAILLASFGLGVLPRASAQVAPKVVEIHLDGMVNPMTAEEITTGIDQAIQQKAALVLLQMNTPGGLDTSMRAIIQKIITSPVPVVGYVAPSGSRAASAGFFILLSTDIAAMAPGTNTGAAHPVMIGGQMDDVESQKVTNDAAAYLRSIASKRGRNAALAQQGIYESKSFTEQEALDGHLINLIATDRSQLLQKLNGYTVTRFDGTKQVLHLSGAQIEVFQPSARQQFLSEILDPNLAFILLILGALGLYVEFTHPGLIVPGVAGGILLILGLFALSLLPVNWAGAALIFLALVFFVLEAKFATHGVLAAGGVAAMVLGALMLINTHLPGGGVTLPTAVSVALPFGLITVFLLRLVIRSQRQKVATGAAGMMGEIGRVETTLAPEGKVYVHGELWRAVSSEQAPPGTLVRVKKLEGMVLEVEPVSVSRPEAQHPPSGSQPEKGA